MTPARDPLKVLAGPMLAYFDKRFQAVYDRIDDRMNELYARVATEVERDNEVRRRDVGAEPGSERVRRFTVEQR